MHHRANAQFFKEALTFLPLLLFSLLFNSSLFKRILFFCLFAIPSIFLAIQWTGRPDLEGLILLFYPIPLFFFVLISHPIFLKFSSTPSQLSNQNQSINFFILLFLILSLLFFSFSFYYKYTEYAQFALYEKARCYGNTMSLVDFEKTCNGLTSSFFKGYYQDLCFNAINERKQGLNSTFFRLSSSPVLNSRGEIIAYNLEPEFGCEDSQRFITFGSF
jgi:hypothetical protein